MAQPSISAKRQKDNQKRLGDSIGCLSAEDKLWRKAMYSLKMTKAQTTTGKRMTRLRFDV